VAPLAASRWTRGGGDVIKTQRSSRRCVALQSGRPAADKATLRIYPDVLLHTLTSSEPPIPTRSPPSRRTGTYAVLLMGVLVCLEVYAGSSATRRRRAESFCDRISGWWWWSLCRAARGFCNARVAWCPVWVALSLSLCVCVA